VAGDAQSLTLQVEYIEELGAQRLVHCTIDGKKLTAPLSPEIEIGESQSLSIAPERLHFSIPRRANAWHSRSRHPRAGAWRDLRSRSTSGEGRNGRCRPETADHTTLRGLFIKLKAEGLTQRSLFHGALVRFWL
jgi:hypothetical protein